MDIGFLVVLLSIVLVANCGVLPMTIDEFKLSKHAYNSQLQPNDEGLFRRNRELVHDPILRELTQDVSISSAHRKKLPQPLTSTPVHRTFTPGAPIIASIILTDSRRFEILRSIADHSMLSIMPKPNIWIATNAISYITSAYRGESILREARTLATYSAAFNYIEAHFKKTLFRSFSDTKQIIDDIKSGNGTSSAVDEY